MRLITFILLSTLGQYVYADQQSNAQQSSPLPDLGGEPTGNEPQVTITKRTGQTIEEYRVGGRLYMIKVTPKHGKPYYLIDDRGDGKFARQDSLDSGVRPPQWVIHRF